MTAMFFCSLGEAAQRLQKTEKELKQIVKQGGLQDYRDGANLLFRVDEVEALVKEKDITMQSGALAARSAGTGGVLARRMPYFHGFSPMSWVFQGLSRDCPLAVLAFCAILCAFLSVVIALGYLSSKLL